MRAFLSLSVVVVREDCSPGMVGGPLIAVASLAQDQEHVGFSGCGWWAQQFWALEHKLNSCGTWA